MQNNDHILFVKEEDKWTVLMLPSDPVEALRYLGKKAKLKGVATEVHREMETWEREG